MTGNILSHFIVAIGFILNAVLSFYIFVIFAAVILSWLRPSPDSPFIRQLITMIYRLTEPVFSKVRRILPAALFRSGLDVTPMIVLLALYALKIIVNGVFQEVIFAMRVSL